MRLSDLLTFDDIVIQCHDNPDADALASGFALYYYFAKNGKEPKFIYRGINEIKKSNLLIMVEELENFCIHICILPELLLISRVQVIQQRCWFFPEAWLKMKILATSLICGEEL